MLSLDCIDKIRNHLVAKPIDKLRTFMQTYTFTNARNENYKRYNLYVLDHFAYYAYTVHLWTFKFRINAISDR